MKQIVITNVVYGQAYAELFLTQHIPCMIDESNLPAYRHRLRYIIYTDSETKDIIEDSPMYHKLRNACPTIITEFTWESDGDRYKQRYQLLVKVFQSVLKYALANDFLMMFVVADLVVAKGFMKKLIDKMDEGHGGVLSMPMRATHETMAKFLAMCGGALEPLNLFELAYKHMSPIFSATHFRSPQFTRFPSSLTWNLTNGLLLRSYSLTPFIFKPTESMLKINSTIDEEVPAHVENPFVATDWVDCPAVCVEFMGSFFPIFSNSPADVNEIREWSTKLHESQRGHLKHKLYYPSHELVALDHKQEQESDEVVAALTRDPEA